MQDDNFLTLTPINTTTLKLHPRCHPDSHACPSVGIGVRRSSLSTTKHKTIRISGKTILSYLTGTFGEGFSHPNLD